MTVLKKIGIILGIVLLLFLILGLVMPKDITVNYTRSIDVPANYLYNMAQDLKAAATWNPFIAEDPTMEISYSEKTTGEVASYTWKSEAMGNGSAVYTKLIPNQRIDADMTFEGMDKSKYYYEFKADGNKATDMSWTMETHLGFPYNVFGPFFKYSIKKNYKKGLATLEELAEKRYEDNIYNGYEVMDKSQPKRHFIMSRNVVAFDDIQKFYTQNLGAIFQKVQSEGLTMKGMPCVLFFKYDHTNKTTDMAAAIPVNEEKTIKDLTSITIEDRPAIVVDYYGKYEEPGKAHDAIDAYMADHALLMDAPAIEEYLTDPLKEKDPSKWLTKVIYYYTKVNR